jgi:hypothetical protein
MAANAAERLSLRGFVIARVLAELSRAAKTPGPPKQGYLDPAWTAAQATPIVPREWVASSMGMSGSDIKAGLANR